MAAHLLILDDHQSEQLRIEADDHNETISAYVALVLTECEIIPPATPTPTELVQLAVDIACGSRPVRDRTRVQRWLRAEQDRLRSSLLAVSTGLQVIEEEVEEVPVTTTSTTTATHAPIWVADERVEPAWEAWRAAHAAEEAALEAAWAAQEVEQEVIEQEQVEQEEVIEPEEDDEQVESVQCAHTEKEQVIEEVEEVIEEESTESEQDAVHWLDSWLPGVDVDCEPPKRRRKPGGPQVLDVGDVLAIRRALASGRLLQREIATAYGCSRSNISKVKNGVSWQGVCDDD